MTTVSSNIKSVDQKDLESRVKKMYQQVALHPEVTYHFEMGRALANRLGYPADVLNRIPSESIDSFAGVGYYFDLLKLQAGEKVVDLGSGSGMDVFFAATQVTDSGRVTGVDMTDEQLEKAAHLAHKDDALHVDFQKGYIEDLSIPSGSADAVISNGVINLSSDKKKVFLEAARVLKPGGRLAISDIVSSIKLPESISCNATLWAACIGGAMQIDEYKALIEEAGLRVERVKDNPYAFISNSAKGATEDYGIKSISVLAIKQ